jgi:hypothetical protein
MSSDEGAAVAVVKDVGRMEIDELDSLADNEDSRTSAGQVVAVAGYINFGHVDHEIAAKPQMLGSWIAECGKSVDKGAACVRLLP